MGRWLVGLSTVSSFFKVNPTSGWLQTTGLQVMDADPSINEAPPSIDEVKDAVAKLRSGKAAGICNIREEFLKVGGEAMIRRIACCLDCCMAFRYHSS